MGIFDRMTFPASAIYNIKTDVVVELDGVADVEVVKSNTNVVKIDVSNMTFNEAEKCVTDVKNCLKEEFKINRKPKFLNSISSFFRKFIEMLGYVC